MANSDKKISELVEKVLQNPILLQKLSNKVYELIQSDYQNQRSKF